MAIGGIRFTREIALGSVLTIALVVVSALVGGWFYLAMDGRVRDGNAIQKENQQRIEGIADNLAAYRETAREHALYLSKRLDELRRELDELKRNVDPRRSHN